MKRNGLKAVLTKIITGVLLVIILLCGGIIGFRVYFMIKDKVNKDETKEIRKSIEAELETEDDTEDDTEGETNKKKRKKTLSEIESHVSDLSDKGKEISRKLLEELRDKYSNNDIVGYLVLDGQDIEYPILQGDTNDSYIKTSPYGGYDYNGSIFLDADNTSDFFDSRSVVYGHNMRNGSMFGSLRNIYESNIDDKYFTVYSESGVLKYKLLSSELVYAYGENYMVFPAKEMYKDILNSGKTILDARDSDVEQVEMASFYEKLKSSSLSWCDDTDYDENSIILSLMTCYADGGTYRFAISGVLQL